MKSKLLILSFLTLFIIAISPNVKAEAICFPDNTGQLCLDAVFNNGYLYCDIDDVVQCSTDYSTNPPTGGCFANPNGEDCCADAVGCLDTPPVCGNGEEACCNSAEDCENNIYRENGDAYECLSGQWERTEQCTGTDKCIESGNQQAYCDMKKYYCPNIDRAECYWTTDANAGCFNTLEQCLDSLPVYCINTETNVCTKRFGGLDACLEGELYRVGTGIDDEWCANYGERPKCESCFSWLWGNKISSDPLDTCNADVVWESDSFLGKAFGLQINQDQWCPFWLIFVGSTIIIVIAIVVGIIMYSKKGRRRK